MARVLLVDDEPMLRMALRELLEFAGYAVEEAHDGDEALERARRTRPDIVVSDVLMPQRDGMSLCRELRADPQLADVPVLFITARNTQSELYDEIGRIADGCVVKPFEPDHLLEAIDRAMKNVRKV
jgi:two-component system, OmpR family, phosphate regulon response regulator PhoB